MAIIVGTDTYISVADATAYFKYAIHASSWNSASTGVKESSLVTATRTLDRQDWAGSKYDVGQALEWPRSGLTDKNGVVIDETTVPQQIIDATCEYAIALIDNNALQNETSSGSNIKKLKAGSAEIEFIRATFGPKFPTIVNELVGLWLTGSSRYSGPFVSGADAESPLSSSFDLTRGY